MASSVSSDLYREERTRTNKFTCDLCGCWWPIAHRVFQAPYWVGRVCCYEPDGGEIDRDLKRAQADVIAAQLSAKEQMPPGIREEGFFYPGSAYFNDPSWITAFSASPLILTRGGAAQTLVLTGEGFTSSDGMTYGSAGITDAALPVLAGTTQWTLSVQAAIGVAQGRYRFVFNQDIFQEVFEVRDP